MSRYLLYPGTFNPINIAQSVVPFILADKFKCNKVIYIVDGSQAACRDVPSPLNRVRVINGALNHVAPSHYQCYYSWIPGLTISGVIQDVITLHNRYITRPRKYVLAGGTDFFAELMRNKTEFDKILEMVDKTKKKSFQLLAHSRYRHDPSSVLPLIDDKTIQYEVVPDFSCDSNDVAMELLHGYRDTPAQKRQILPGAFDAIVRDKLYQ
jgi:hypothetical protein